MYTARKTIRVNGKPGTIFVKYGIDNCAPGRQPYSFSITGVVTRSTQYDTAESTPDRLWDTCGCIHEEIEKHFPGKFSDLIAFHLRHENGEPMYPEANLYFQYQVYKGQQTWNNFTPERAFDWFSGDLLLSKQRTMQLIERLDKCSDPAKYIKKYIHYLRPMWKKSARALKTKYNLPDFEIFD